MINRYKAENPLKQRLDVFLAEKSGLTRSYIKRLCDDGAASVDGKIVKASHELMGGENVELDIPKPQDLDLEPENLPLDIVYQDQSIAVINKAQGVTVHAGGGTRGNTLVNALLFHLDSLSGINGVIRPGIVHRIDKDTSGLLVVAKNDRAHLALSAQLEDKTLGRSYLALLEGNVKADEGRIETFIGRNPRDRKSMAVTSSGRRAVTNYTVKARFEGFTLCEFRLETGRTHQIRVHAKYIGHPVVGDPVYGYKAQKFKLNGQLLHAYKLRLVHPDTGESMEFTAPLPDYFEKVLKSLKKC